jgi:hypothetical protein
MKSAKAVADMGAIADPKFKAAYNELSKAMEQYDMQLKALKGVLRKCFHPLTIIPLQQALGKCMNIALFRVKAIDNHWDDTVGGKAFSDWTFRQMKFTGMLHKLQKTQITRIMGAARKAQAEAEVAAALQKAAGEAQKDAGARDMYSAYK